MADTQSREEQRNEVIVAKNKNELVARNAASVTPYAVTQSTFPEQIRQGLPGMVNRMVDYNAVTRSVETPAAGIPPARAVSQSSASDIGCVLGGTANGFIGLSILDPTVIQPYGSGNPIDNYPQYTNIGILTKGEMFAGCVVACVAGDPVSFVAVDGTLTNTGGVVIPGARWKHTRPTPGDLNVVQLGIQR